MNKGLQIVTTVRTTRAFVSPQAECMIVPLWRRGNDTAEIAKQLGLPECEIANRLLTLRDRHKQMQEGR